MSSGLFILSTGLPADVQVILKDLFEISKVTERPLDIQQLMEPLDPVPHIVLCGHSEKTPMAEFAQLLRVVYPSSLIYYITKTWQGYDRKFMMANGFSDSFLLPIDQDTLRTKISQDLTILSKGRSVSYYPIKLVDIKPGSSLPFDTFIYMPVNRKYLQYTKLGDPIDQERANQLSSHQVGTIHLKADQIQAFFDYARSHSGGADAAANELGGYTELQQKLRTATRDYLNTFFSTNTQENDGKALSATLTDILNKYILSFDPSKLTLALSAWSGEPYDFFGHLTNVSFYSALISMGLAIGNAADLAAAGLFHDIGWANVAMPIREKAESERDAEETKKFQAHPEHSIALLKNRKISLSADTLRIISQHHEHLDGSGYPNSSRDVSLEAQVLAIVDLIDEAITVTPGKSRLNPTQALESINKKWFSDGLVDKIQGLFPLKA